MSNSSFAQMRKSSKKSLKELQEKTKAQNEKQDYKDARFWEPTVDKAGNGSAVIRFLPAPKDNIAPWVRYWDHFFQGPGGWFVEKSRTSLGDSDPVSEYNRVLWNSETKANQEIARKQKRKLHYVTNIYVVEDPGNPENQGKVFLYNYGATIYEKIDLIMNPTSSRKQPINPFDLWAGADFEIAIKLKGDYRNYDDSSFLDPAPLLADDEALEKVWESEYDLKEFVTDAAPHYKSFEELKARLHKVLAVPENQELSVPVAQPLVNSATDDIPFPYEKDSKPVTAEQVIDSDSQLEEFQKLAE